MTIDDLPPGEWGISPLAPSPELASLMEYQRELARQCFNRFSIPEYMLRDVREEFDRVTALIPLPSFALVSYNPAPPVSADA